MALTKEDLLAIEQIFDQKMAEKLEPIREDITQIKQDISQIKEDTAITRDVVNGLSEWVEVASDVLKIEYPIHE